MIGRGSRRLAWAGVVLALLGCAVVVAAARLRPRRLPGDAAAFALGQPHLWAQGHNRVDARGMLAPAAVAIDTSATPARLYVADTANHRVLGYRSLDGLRTGAPADLVLGQPDFSSAQLREDSADPAWLLAPTALAVDPRGRLLVADRGANRVLVYQAPFDGSRMPSLAWGGLGHRHGSASDEASAALGLLAGPSGVAVSASGNVFVADTDHHRVLVFSSLDAIGDEPVRILGQLALADARPSAGRQGLNSPTGLAVDGEGRLAVADTGNHRVLIFDDPYSGDALADLVIGQDDFSSQQPGQGPFGLRAPGAVAFDEHGRLWIADSGNHRVLGYDAPSAAHTAPRALVGGQGRLRASSPQADPVSPRTLFAPGGVAARGDLLLVADTRNHRVLAIPQAWSPDPAAAVALGQADLESCSENLTDALGLFFPHAAAVDRGARPNRLYIADTENNRVLAYRDVTALATDTPPDLVLGQPDAYASLPNHPALLAASGDAASARTLRLPAGVAVDGRSNLAVADRENNRVLIYRDPFADDTAADAVLGQHGSFSSVEANRGGVSARSLFRPEGVAFDRRGRLYVADTRNHRVLRFDDPFRGNDAADAVWGQGGCMVKRDEHAGGRISGLGFSLPYGVDVRGDGTLAVADTNNHRVLIFPRGAHAAARVLGQEGDMHSARDNRGGVSAASLSGPQGVRWLPRGGLLVADTANSRVLVFARPLAHAPRAALVYGQAGNMGSDAPGAGPRGLWFPYSADYDADMNLYVCDKGQSRVTVYRAR